MYKPLTFAVATLTAVQACSTQIGTDGAYFDLCSLYKKGGYVSPVVPGTASKIRITFNYCRRYEASQNNGANAAAWFSSFYARNQWGDMIADQDIDEAFSTEAIMTDDKITGVNVVQLASYWLKKDLPQCHLRSIINCDEAIIDLDPSTIIPSKVAEPGCEYIMEFSHKSGCPVAKPEPLPTIVNGPDAGLSQSNPMRYRFGDETSCWNAEVNYWSTGGGANTGYSDADRRFGAELNYGNLITSLPTSDNVTAQWCLEFPGVNEQTLDCAKINTSFVTSAITTENPNPVAVTSTVTDTYGEDYTAQKVDGADKDYVNWVKVGESDTRSCTASIAGDQVTCPNYKIAFERDFIADQASSRDVIFEKTLISQSWEDQSLQTLQDYSMSWEDQSLQTLVTFQDYSIQGEKNFSFVTNAVKARRQEYADSKTMYDILIAEYDRMPFMLEESLRWIEGALLLLEVRYSSKFGVEEDAFYLAEFNKLEVLKKDLEEDVAALDALKAEKNSHQDVSSTEVDWKASADQALFNALWDYDLEAFALRLTNKTGQEKLTEAKNLIKENSKSVDNIMNLYDRYATYQKYGFLDESAVSMAGYSAVTVAVTVYALMF